MSPAPGRWRSEIREQGELTVHVLRWIVLGIVSGLLAGLSSWIFLEVLDRVTEIRIDHDWLLYLLPAAGLVIGVAYHHLGGRSRQGNALLLDQIHEPTEWVPKRMAPFVLVGTWTTHLFGGSAGREGTALQMSGSLTDGVSRLLRLGSDDRRIMLITALGGGFGAVFGVPLAGAVFAMEVQAIGRVRYEAIVPALTAALVGDLVVDGLGYEHPIRDQLDASLDISLLLKIAVAGLAFGLTGALFAEATHGVRTLATKFVGYAPLRLVLGGVGVIGLAALFGHDYLGLSLPLIDEALAGDDIGLQVFALKLVFTAVTVGSGFPGGEVTPLFVIGATLGSALAEPLGLDPRLLAAVGFVAVFAGAANVPLACTIMGAEIFGAGIVAPLAVGCVISYVFSSHRGIYATQRIDAAKGPTAISGSPTILHWSRRRR